MFRFSYLVDKPIIDVQRYAQLEGNANGPCLIKIPGWIKSPKARYYLYFAHHEGTSIRLAFADALVGPWRLSETPALALSESLFTTLPPLERNLANEALTYIARGTDGYYPHIASPDIIIDDDKRQIRLYYHGRLSNGLQRTRVAISSDGLNFSARHEVLGLPYFRVFRNSGFHYALAFSGRLYRSSDGLGDFQQGPQMTREPMRHFALHRYQNHWLIFWTRAGDNPERILMSRISSEGDWNNWKIGPAVEIHRPLRCWEGADEPLIPSSFGTSMVAVNQLRDPCIYTENKHLYLLYSVAGEQGIGIGELIAV